ncbi:hypothetical protein [Azonexus hydrophilus]|uniref:Uncharacterized protein n=1 Tax=Azonexus hydrophilus TaxID=418702 RepID=A0ABZ2XNJ0_9RHOO
MINPINIEPANPMQKIIYMVHDDDGALAGGPLLGAPGIDFPLLAAEFRAERYAKAEDAGEDYCWLSESEFVSWLLERQILSPMKTVDVSIKIETQYEHRYVPKHWPLCPECSIGRGEENMGRVLHSLNRADWHRKCTECGHDWDHRDEPYLYKQPMLEDDGRCVASGCVPYSISQAGEVPMADVLVVCSKHGWSENNGMYDTHGVLAAGELGIRMLPRKTDITEGKLTLRKLLDMLSPTKNYIIATRKHWLAVVKGENRDQADTGMRAEVSAYWEVLPVNSQGALD